MVATVSFNYLPVVNAPGSFTIQTYGVVQGFYQDDPTNRFDLRSGVVSNSETLPMWGGVGIYENIPTGGYSSTVPGPQLGNVIGRATSLTKTSAGGLTGWSLFNQTYNGVTTPQSPVPLVGSGGTFNYARLGSGLRITVACDPSLASLYTDPVNQQVSWDWNNQVLQPYSASTATFSITSITWASTSGGLGTVVAGVATPVAGVGDLIFISGATNTGTGGAAAVNGSFVVFAFTDNQHFVLAMPAATGVIGTIGGTILGNYGTGALPVTINEIFPNGCMTVQYSSYYQTAVWNRNGACADITI